MCDPMCNILPFGIQTEIRFIWINHVYLKHKVLSISVNTVYTNLYKSNICSMGYQMTRYRTLSNTFLSFCFSAQNVIMWPVAQFTWYQYRIIEHTRKIPIDSM